MKLEFGVFDHLDATTCPCVNLRTAAQDHRGVRSLRLLRLSRRRTPFHAAGHGPSPSVFLSAIAQRTGRLRFGTFVYALPVHHPLRVFEEFACSII